MVEIVRAGFTLALALPLLLASLDGCQAEPILPPAEPSATQSPSSVEAPPSELEQAAPALKREDWVGVVVAARAVEVEPAFVTEIEQVFVEPGEQVVTGQPLALLDGERLRESLAIASAELRSQRAALSSARIDEEQGRDELARLEGLAADGHVSREVLSGAEFDARRAEASVRRAEGALAEARARVDGLEARLADLSITAPFAGVVAERYLDAGAVTGPGDPIVRLIAGDAAWVRFAIPAERGLGLGELLEIEVAGERYRGWVRQVAPQLDPAAGLRFIDAQTELGFEGLAVGSAVLVRPADEQSAISLELAKTAANGGA